MSCCCGPNLGAGLGAVRVSQWQFYPNVTTAPTGEGIVAPTVTGTATARATSQLNLLTNARRQGYVSAAAINSVAGVRANMRQFCPSITNLGAGRFRGGGFRFITEFAISDAVLNGEARMFVGLRNATGVPAAQDPITLGDSIGVGCDNGDTTLRVYAVDSGGVGQEVDLGVNFPVNVTGVNAYWRFVLSADPAQAAVAATFVWRWSVERMQTGHIASGTFMGGLVPDPALEFTPNMWRATGPVNAAAVGIDFAFMRLETQT